MSKQTTHLIISFISDDRPGIVEQLSNIIESHQGNWLESKLAQLSGKFTGIIELSIPVENSAALIAALKPLNEQGIALLIEEASSTDAPDSAKAACVSVLGLDRPGIIKELSEALAKEHINVTELYSFVEAAPMSGEPLFKADIDIAIPASVSIESLDESLEGICDKLDVEYSISFQLN